MTTLYWEEEKDPADVDYYSADVDTGWLGAETISGVTFEPASGSGIAITNQGINGNEVRAQFSGGNVGTHTVEITVTTSTGRIRQRTVFLVVREK